MTDEQKLTLEEIASRLDLSPQQFNTRVCKEAIPHYRIGNRKRFDAYTVMQHLGLVSKFPNDRPREYFTYLIWAKGSRFYKIGMAFDPRKRLRELSTGSPFKLQLLAAIPYRLVPEYALHRQYKDHRRNGEWFEFMKREDILSAYLEWTVEFYLNYIGGSDAS